MAFTVRTMEAFLEVMEVIGEDHQTIMNRTRNFEEDNGWVAGGNLSRILQGYPELQEHLDQNMFERLALDDPSLLTP